MRDVALDPATGDLALVPTAGGVGLTLTEGVGAVRQRLMLRLSLWKGEYAPDRDKGIPYASLLGKGTRTLLEATLRQAITTCPGVAALRSFRLTVDATRRAFVTFQAIAASGEPVSLDAFQVA